MINPDDFRKSAYFKTADLTATRTRVRLAAVTEEAVGTPAENKVVLQFTTTTLKPMIVNYTNLVALVDAFGADETKWVGRIIVLLKTKAIYQGKAIDATRIEIPEQAPPAAEPPPVPDEVLVQDDAEAVEDTELL